MAIDRRQALRDRAGKVGAEERLKVRLRRLGELLARELVSALASGRGVSTLEAQTVEVLEPILLEHYLEVSSTFSRRLSVRLPAEVSETNGERKRIEQRLRGLFERRAASQAGFIGRTVREDADFARRVVQLTSEGGESPLEVAAAIGAGFVRKFEGREATRAMFETQVAAELSKQVEAEVLSGSETDGEMGIEPKARRRPPDKEWISQGDDLTRPWHLEADSKRVPLDQPFTVRGERLMFPGDASLGATKLNLLGCRCSSVVDYSSVVVSRRSRIAAGLVAVGLLGDELSSPQD